MKIAITGKGGVGKTTFAATLARLYAEEGRTVLAADVDPDANLGLALGFPEEILDSITPISKMRRLIEERTGAGPDNQMYKLNPKVDDIPDTYSKVYNGVKLLLLGTVETGGGGCVCPEQALSMPGILSTAVFVSMIRFGSVTCITNRWRNTVASRSPYTPPSSYFST